MKAVSPKITGIYFRMWFPSAQGVNGEICPPRPETCLTNARQPVGSGVVIDQHNSSERTGIPGRPSDPAPVRNPALLVALALAGLEALLLLVAAVWSLVSIVTDADPQALVSVALAVVLVLLALLLAVGVRALWHGRRWGRGPVITWQLLQAAITLGMVGLAPSWLVVVLLAACLVIVVGLLLPASVAATSQTSSSSTVL